MAYLVWQGNSVLSGIDATGADIGKGAPIGVFAVPASTNGKTGAMWQMYILRTDIKPTDAVAQGLDAAVCGNCPHRKATSEDGKGTCYTYGTTIVAANGIYRAHGAGKSLPFTADMVKGSPVRFGAYGDPAAVPYDVWQPILDACADHGWTAYTHQWRTADARFRTFCQASCDNLSDQADATAAGWRTYTVAPVGTTRVPGAVPCPSPRIACADCLKCSGTGLGRKGNVWIEAHGSRAKSFVGQSLPLSVS